MHLASIDNAQDQKKLEEHIESIGLGHEHFWTSGTDQGEEGKFVWVLYCDLMCLDYDGNINDACSLALLAALKDGRFTCPAFCAKR